MSVLMKNEQMLAGLVPSEESVSVTADGVKTYGQLFNALFALADTSKIGRSSSIVVVDQVFFASRDGENGIYEFAFFNMAKQSPFLFLYRLRISNNSEMVVFNPSGFSDETSSVPASGAKITLYY